jgi:hypothetical protein
MGLIFTGDIVKMPDNPTHGRIGTDGLFKVVIQAQPKEVGIEAWEDFETTVENVTFEEGLRIERARLDELAVAYA